MGVHLVTGSDPVLIGTRVVELVHQLVGDGDRTLMVDEFEPVPGEGEVGRIVDAAQTPPFLTDHRVVVARGLGALNEEELAPLVAHLADPSPTTELVLVLETSKTTGAAKALTDAVKAAAGHIVRVGVPSRKQDVEAWVDEQISASGLQPDRAAVSTIRSWLGEDLNRLPALLDTLVGVYGEGARLGTADVEPYLGPPGGVPPWDLTDAIDAGDTSRALVHLHRMLGSGERHPLQVMGILTSHYTRMLTLDGTGVSDPRAAAELLGHKSDFQAGKALRQLRAMGSSGVVRAVALLAEADVDLKGDTDLDPTWVMEVLVARLSRLTSRPVSSRR